MRNRKAKPEYQTLKISLAKPENVVKITVSADYELHLSDFLDEGHIELNDKNKTLQDFLFAHICGALFDNGWNRASAERVRLEKFEADPKLLETFQKYSNEYFSLKDGHLKKEAHEEIEKLQNRIATLKAGG